MGAQRRGFGGWGFVCLLGAMAMGCAAESPRAPLVGEGYAWRVPPGFPIPLVPASNPMSDEKVELGQYLFYDPRLSGNGVQRCASCHLQRLAFTDGQGTSLGSTGDVGRRNSPTIANAAYAATLTWGQPIATLEEQILLPLFGEEPVELGLAPREAIAWEHLAYDPVYEELFAAAWPADPAVTRDHVVDALAAFVRSVISAESPYDRYRAGDAAALGDDAVRGLALFESPRLACAECHGGFLLSANVAAEHVEPAPVFHNDALYDIDGTGAYPPDDPGLVAVTGAPADMGRFRPPSLRNVAITAPYFHDGSAATLDDVLDGYARGGRLVLDGPYPGDGALNPYKSPLLTGFTLTEGERADLLAFLAALTDESLLTDERWADPWTWNP